MNTEIPEDHIFEGPRDRDTLGGRIGRAREVLGLTSEEAAEKIGVTLETYDNWESDRDEPRANKLAMLAGVLSVSPTWLLHGIGEAPAYENIAEEITNLKSQLLRLQHLHEASGEAMQMIESAIERLAENYK